jgi:hypothetical protein
MQGRFAAIPKEPTFSLTVAPVVSCCDFFKLTNYRSCCKPLRSSQALLCCRFNLASNQSFTTEWADISAYPWRVWKASFSSTWRSRSAEGQDRVLQICDSGLAVDARVPVAIWILLANSFLRPPVFINWFSRR